MEFLKKYGYGGEGEGGRYFLTFQPKDIFNLFLDLNASLPIYAYKCYAFQKSVLFAFVTKKNHFGSYLH